MTDNTLLGPWIRRFLLEYLRRDRNLRENTQYSYRDCLTLLLPFLANKVGLPIERLTIEHFLQIMFASSYTILKRIDIAQSQLIING